MFDQLTPEYRPEKGWLSRQLAAVEWDVAEWPEWMKQESGRMEKTDMTLAEMRERLEKAKEWHQPCYEDWLSRNSWILELASAELARREEMENSNG